jgi:hypothetical protein
LRVYNHTLAELGTLQAGLAPPRQPHDPKTSFASVLAETTTTTTAPATGTAGADSVPAAGEQAQDDALPKGPKGETTRAVEDHTAYVEVTSGPRKGMFVNTTHNERRGEPFVLVHKGDRDLHIYGTGKHRRVIISWHKDQPAHADDAKQVKPADDAKQSAPASGGTAAP